MKSMKFTAGTYLEVDDLSGGRKVVMVGRDGSTYWDLEDADNVTPLVIHPSLTPKTLGSIADFVEAEGLQPNVENIVGRLKAEDKQPEQNPLFVMRVLWAFSQMHGGDDERYTAALETAKKQEATAIKLHEKTKQYCDSK